ncbi:MAG TPA: HEPN domain-containing protein [Actinomycetes bacterium]|jgi:HEPN domain-containing protein|nr:HEPN domain-containing protein [Actinomycetes bacterium]
MNDRAERLRREAWRWLRLAREDQAAAIHLAAAADLPYRIACLLAQQAAEKAIKAVLVAEDVDPPKLHDLRRLLERCSSPIMSELNEPALEDLSRWSIAGRYPADVDEGTAADAQDCLEAASRVLGRAAEVVVELVGTEPAARTEREQEP